MPIFRIPLILLAQLLALTIAGVVNHALAPWQVSLFSWGLLIIFPVLLMGPREGLLSSMLAGLLMDAATPGNFGQGALLLGLAHLLVLQLRPRLALDENAVQIFMAVCINLALYLVRLIQLTPALPSVSDIWGRFLWEILLSSLFVGLVSPWFQAFQRELLKLASLPVFRRNDEED